MLFGKKMFFIWVVLVSAHFCLLDAGKKRDSNRPEKQYQIDGQVIIDLLRKQDITYEALWAGYNNQEISLDELSVTIVQALQNTLNGVIITLDKDATVDEYLKFFLQAAPLELEQSEKIFLKNNIKKIKENLKFQNVDSGRKKCMQWTLSREWAAYNSCDLLHLIADAICVIFDQKSDKSELPEFTLVVSNLQAGYSVRILVHSLIKNEEHKNVVPHFEPMVLHDLGFQRQGQENDYSDRARTIGCECPFFCVIISPLIFVLTLEVIAFCILQRALEMKYS